MFITRGCKLVEVIPFGGESHENYKALHKEGEKQGPDWLAEICSWIEEALENMNRAFEIPLSEISLPEIPLVNKKIIDDEYNECQ